MELPQSVRCAEVMAFIDISSLSMSVFPPSSLCKYLIHLVRDAKVACSAFRSHSLALPQLKSDGKIL